MSPSISVSINKKKSGKEIFFFETVNHHALLIVVKKKKIFFQIDYPNFRDIIQQMGEKKVASDINE